MEGRALHRPRGRPPKKPKTRGTDIGYSSSDSDHANDSLRSSKQPHHRNDDRPTPRSVNSINKKAGPRRTNNNSGSINVDTSHSRLKCGGNVSDGSSESPALSSAPRRAAHDLALFFTKKRKDSETKHDGGRRERRMSTSVGTMDSAKHSGDMDEMRSSCFAPRVTLTAGYAPPQEFIEVLHVLATSWKGETKKRRRSSAITGGAESASSEKAAASSYVQIFATGSAHRKDFLRSPVDDLPHPTPAPSKNQSWPSLSASLPPRKANDFASCPPVAESDSSQSHTTTPTLNAPPSFVPQNRNLRKIESRIKRTIEDSSDDDTPLSRRANVAPVPAPARTSSTKSASTEKWAADVVEGERRRKEGRVERPNLARPADEALDDDEESETEKCIQLAKTEAKALKESFDSTMKTFLELRLQEIQHEEALLKAGCHPEILEEEKQMKEKNETQLKRIARKHQLSIDSANLSYTAAQKQANDDFQEKCRKIKQEMLLKLYDDRARIEREHRAESAFQIDLDSLASRQPTHYPPPCSGLCSIDLNEDVMVLRLLKGA